MNDSEKGQAYFRDFIELSKAAESMGVLPAQVLAMAEANEIALYKFLHRVSIQQDDALAIVEIEGSNVDISQRLSKMQTVFRKDVVGLEGLSTEPAATYSGRGISEAAITDIMLGYANPDLLFVSKSDVEEHLRKSSADGFGRAKGFVKTDNENLPAKVDPRERKSMLRIIHALSIVAEIKDRAYAKKKSVELEKLGYQSPSERTIRDIIKEARKQE